MRKFMTEKKTEISEQVDEIFAAPLAEVQDFKFDAQVANVFPDMIRRSIPGYGSILSMLGIFARRYVQDESNIYDLGCSLGAATLAMRRRLDQANCRIIAVDNSPEMIDRARRYLDADTSYTPVELRCEDIRETDIQTASMVVSNFTLQFVPPEDRLALLKKIYAGINNGGALIISEKTKFKHSHRQELYTDWYHDFKKANGYSELEVSQKRTALENVMKLDTLYVHKERLQQAGFKQITCWFQCLNFISLLALK